MQGKLKVLRNVFIPYKKNKLKLVDIIFNEKIDAINSRYKRGIPWEAISTVEERDEFVKDVRSFYYDSSYELIDCGYQFVMPGSIDPRVHLVVPENNDFDGFKNGSLSAAYGGVTTVIAVPSVTNPGITSSENFNEICKLTQGNSLVDYAFWGGIDGDDFYKNIDMQRKVWDLAQTGVIGFYAYLSNVFESMKRINYDQMRNLGRWIKTTGLPLILHPEDYEMVSQKNYRAKRLKLNDRNTFYKIHDEQAEREAIKNIIAMAHEYNSYVHISNISSLVSLKEISGNKKGNTRISVDTAPHYLHFNRTDIKNAETEVKLKTIPTIKNDYDVEALWNGINNNLINFIASDHFNMNPEKYKNHEDFPGALSGVSGLQTRVSYVISEGFKKGRIDLETAVNLLCTMPATTFRLKQKGLLERGRDADFVLIDLWNKTKFSEKDLMNKYHYSPFDGMEFELRILRTILRGKTIMSSDGNFEADYSYGKLMKQKNRLF
ncbi:MAG: dihydroorotase family protein [Melioribacteraceae bacterium]|nr:dihydroorotase family protein [Melioribacteraceae bacterium]MCF8352995.1 dihydroorotase family protein [Melioribacteraceae bacterium]MCF8392886.1 dihydroorotase family protein [Melioribacteraceae bacterium]MCF8417820.1 dihydroorotase family protein [Melioribacteraceae bacterium]